MTHQGAPRSRVEVGLGSSGPQPPANDGESSERLLTVLRNNVRQYGMLFALVVIIAFFQFTTDGTMLKPQNVTNVFLQNGYIIVMALGMLLIIVAGHIDLSVGSVAAFTGAIAAVLMVNDGLDPILASAI
jgi:putative multiple sugar transport system permease protein